MSRTPPPLEDAAALANATALDEAGHAVRLGELWREGPVVLAFLRHFG